ncbi:MULTISPECIES: helix-turn-helix transcriptional regulator [unclassified Nocardiopsis]|uniref:helix-turn-helix domain-containing protein n=1 Tax=unclassified Nocardiopsis TaxID=2649073 RepID=UPI00135B5B90|nr:MULTISPECIES: helix-turn-helix transcriptional regulator [unclassified Nocardiopsis]
MPRGKGLPLDPTRLRAARTAAGLSQRQVAEALGTTRQQVIRYEGGQERPEVKRLAALARAIGVSVGDLVVEGALPAGLAGLRVGAGLTLAAAATAVRAQLPAGAGIACSRPVLADAERGVLPPTWEPTPAAGAVRGALGAAYDVDAVAVATAWESTFGAAAATADQTPEQSGSINGTSGEGFSETAPPGPALARATGKWKPLSAWLWERLVQVAAAGSAGADDDWVGGARWQEHLARRERPRGTTGRGYVDDDTAGRYWLTEAGRAHILAHREDYAERYPTVRQPRAVREMTETTLLRVEDPDAYTARTVWGTARVASQRWTIRARVRVLAGGIIDAAAHGREGHVPSVRWMRDDATGGVRPPRVDEVLEVKEWTSPWRSMPDAAPLLPGVRPAPPAGAEELPFANEGQEVEHLLDPTAAQEQAEADQARGVAVLVSGDPAAERPHLAVHVDGEHVGHLEDLRAWNGAPGWAFYSRLTERERRSMTAAEIGGRPPEATTTVTDIAAAVRELLPQALEHPVHITSLHGYHTGLVGMYPQSMERWELYRGRAAGREDVYARGRCWGWLQPAAGGGRTAHTTAGPVPGGPWPTREEAALALWAHLTAPLPPPRLGERARTTRRIRPRRDTRPLCPYTPAELARVRLIRDRPEDEHSPYRAESPTDHRVLGYVWRKDARRWSYAPADPDTGRAAEHPSVLTTPTRAKALEALLAQPGPLWGDPDSAIVH